MARKVYKLLRTQEGSSRIIHNTRGAQVEASVIYCKSGNFHVGPIYIFANC